MGNLRPAPAELTPMRVDRLMAALDQVMVIESHNGDSVLRQIGLSNDEIKAVIRLARKHQMTPIALVATLTRAALEAVEARG